MKYCKLCNVKIVNDKPYCPLCFNEVEDIDECQIDNIVDSSEDSVNNKNHTDNTKNKDSKNTKHKKQSNDIKQHSLYMTRDKNETSIKTQILIFKLFLIITLGVIGIVTYINVLNYSGYMWSITVSLVVMYLWILIRHTIISSRSTIEKVFFQFIGLITLIISSQLIYDSGVWIFDYMLTSIMIAFITILAFIIAISKKRKQKLLPSFLWIAGMLGVFILLWATNLTNDKVMCEIGVAYAIGVMCILLLFGFKTIKNEFQKNYHL